ncbi:MAG: hypothetical protein GY856_31105 [bacterium]|nr:hypothetical protein [bacterium]
MMELASQDERLAYLEARVEALEAALAARSRQLRQLQEHLLPEDLLLLSRLANGLPPLPRQAYDLSLWTETTEMTPADVEDTLRDLWRSLAVLDDPPARDTHAPA